MRPFRFLFVGLMIIGLASCGGGDTATTPIVLPPPTGNGNGDKPPPPDPPWCNTAPCAENHQSCDEDADDCGGCLPEFFLPDGAEAGDPCISEEDLEPVVNLLGVVIGTQPDPQTKIFCDNDLGIFVGAEQIGSKELRIAVNGLVMEAWEPEETTPYHYRFVVNGAEIMVAAVEEVEEPLPGDDGSDGGEGDEDPPEDGAEVQQGGPGVQGGDTFTLAVVALSRDLDGNLIKEIPTDERLISTGEYTLDVDAPTVEITEPSSEFGTPTLTGLTTIVGSAFDDESILRVEVWFQGNIKEEIVSDDGAFSLAFDVEVDLRYEESSDFANLDVQAYDACGHVGGLVDDEGNPGITTKVIAWPWIRSYDHRHLPEDPQIRDSAIVDWDGDGYAEILFATSKGVFLLDNGADGEDLDENGWDPDAGTFPDIEQLTTIPTTLLAIRDLDADGDMDLLTVQDDAGAQALALYRRDAVEEGSDEITLLLTEIAPIPVASTSQVRALLVADFNNTSEEYRRDDVVIVTSGVGETLLLYKRYYDDEAPMAGNPEGVEGEEINVNPILLEFDHCEDADEIFAADADANADAEGTDAAGVIEYVCSNPEKPDQILLGTRCCPQLFGEPIKSGSVKEATYAEAIDVTGPDGVPDGLLDVVMGADQANFIYVWENRFWNTGLLDTAFSDSTVNGIYPLNDGGQKARYFCSGDIIEEGIPEDLEADCDPEAPGYNYACHGHKDLVVGTEKSGTWRVVRGVGGGLYNNKKLPDDPVDLGDVFDMSGTVSPDVVGLVCEDLNQDGHTDVAIISASARLMQVHLGDGTGRFNQVGDSPYMNPVNEGIGFVVGSPPQNLRVGDLNGDGYPDLLMDYASGGFGIFMNTTHLDPATDEPVFDLHATRALVAPLGKAGSSMAGAGGVLSAFTIGDITNDGKPDIVAVTDPNKSDQAKWLVDYHPTAKAYRNWVYDFGKYKFANNIFIWTQQEHFSADTPGFPASYDRHPKEIFQPNAPKYGLVRPKRVQVLDIMQQQAQATPGPDGSPDLILLGGAYGNPPSAVAVLANVTNLGFWDMDCVLYPLGLNPGCTFRPHNGNLDVVDIKAYVWVDPYNEAQIPAFIMGFPKQACDMPGCKCAEINATARECAWSKAKPCDPLSEDQSLCPFWKCWNPGTCESSWPAEIGGGVVAMDKTAIEEPDVGLPTDDPYANGDVMVLNSDTGTLSILKWKGQDKNYPFEPSWEKSVGEKPVYMDLGDMDGDGIVDVAATVKNNVMVAFGQAGAEPLEAFLTVDKDPSVEQKGGVSELVLTDLNADGRLDVVFLLTGYNQIVAYLGIGVDPDGKFTRQFHGPVRVPACTQPSQLLTHDFNGDGCETLAVLCAGAGAVALFENDTCAKLAPTADGGDGS